jgi:hypothetical protein
MIVLVVLISLVWMAGGVICMTIIYRAGIEEGIRRANTPLQVLERSDNNLQAEVRP